MCKSTIYLWFCSLAVVFEFVIPVENILAEYHRENSARVERVESGPSLFWCIDINEGQIINMIVNRQLRYSTDTLYFTRSLWSINQPTAAILQLAWPSWFGPDFGHAKLLALLEFASPPTASAHRPQKHKPTEIRPTFWSVISDQWAFTFIKGIAFSQSHISISVFIIRQWNR